MYASYEISLRIALTNKPHKIGESYLYLILPAIKNAVEVMTDEKRLKEIEKLSLSNNIVLHRIDEISQ